MENFQIELDTDRRTVRLGGELDIASVPKLSRALEQLTVNPGNITLDMDGVSFIDATGIRSIEEAARRLDGKIMLVNSKPLVRRVVGLLGDVGFMLLD